MSTTNDFRNIGYIRLKVKVRMMACSLGELVPVSLLVHHYGHLKLPYLQLIKWYFEATLAHWAYRS